MNKSESENKIERIGVKVKVKSLMCHPDSQPVDKTPKIKVNVKAKTFCEKASAVVKCSNLPVSEYKIEIFVMLPALLTRRPAFK